MILVTDYCATNSIIRKIEKLGKKCVRIHHFMDNPFHYREYMDQIEGLVLSGGQDIHPKLYGEDNTHSHIYGDTLRDAYELQVLQDVLDRNKKVLGICRGHQLLNVFFGGTLHQDIYHAGYNHGGKHYVYMTDGDFGEKLFGRTKETNSLHHQAVKDIATDFSVIGWHIGDDCIEAIYSEKYNCLGVQWHPEMMEGTEEVFEWLTS
jgi:putative glutamine amidotransferase